MPVARPPESKTSGLTTAAGRRPAMQVGDAAAAAWLAPRASVSLVAPPMCGVMNTWGRSSSGCRAPSAGGSTTSSAAPASCPRRSASASSASSTSDSRAVLMKLAPGFIRAKALAPNRCRFAAVARACTDTTSDVGEQRRRS